jgi:hypothetical protein
MKLEGRRPLGSSRRRWEDNIKMDLRDIVLVRVHRIHLAQDTYHWRGVVSTEMKLGVSAKGGKFFTNWATLSFSRTV